MNIEALSEKCYLKAQELLLNKAVKQTEDFDVFQLTDLLIKLELEKIEKDEYSDSKLNYNDEIVSIEEVGELDTIDITVTGDNLFFCNNILTKNSAGLPMSVDWFIALISNDELESLGQIMWKQLKNRYADINYLKRFVTGVDKSKMRLYDVEQSAQEDIVDDRPVMDKSQFGEQDYERNRKDKPFNKEKFGVFS